MGFGAAQGSIPPPESITIVQLSGVDGTTGSGTTVVLQDIPTINQPTISDFTDAGHSHQDAAGGGGLDASAIVSGTFNAGHLQNVIPIYALTDVDSMSNPVSGGGIVIVLQSPGGLAVSDLYVSGTIYASGGLMASGAMLSVPSIDSFISALHDHSDAANGGPISWDAYYGDGVDGNVTIASATTLTRSMFYDQLTIASGVTLITGGFKVFCATSVTNNGTISRAGNFGATGAAGGAGGSIVPGNEAGAGTAGGAGGAGQTTNGSVGVAGTGSTCQGGIGGGGGAGGNGVSGTGGALGAGGSQTLKVSRIADTNLLAGATIVNGGTGAGGGGGGAGNGATAGGKGGGGGGGGGVMVLASKAITNNGTITVAGGAGGAGEDGSVSGVGGGGGGGGGGAGFLWMFYDTIAEIGTVNVSGGTGGAGGVAGGGAGLVGANGTDKSGVATVPVMFSVRTGQYETLADYP